MITWKQPLGKPECPYCYRWIINLWFFSIRLHHWVGSDDLRYLHDHPYAFITIILRGYYFDINEGTTDVLGVGSIRFRRATYRHAVEAGPQGCWSLVFAFPETRKWGFWVNNKFVRSIRYFHQYGHPPCE